MQPQGVWLTLRYKCLSAAASGRVTNVEVQVSLCLHQLAMVHSPNHVTDTYGSHCPCPSASCAMLSLLAWPNHSTPMLRLAPAVCTGCGYWSGPGTIQLSVRAAAAQWARRDVNKIWCSHAGHLAAPGECDPGSTATLFSKAMVDGGWRTELWL